MLDALLDEPQSSILPLHIISTTMFEGWLGGAPDDFVTLVKAAGFSAKAGECLLVPRAGKPPLALLGAGSCAGTGPGSGTISGPESGTHAFALGNASCILPPGNYSLVFVPENFDLQALALAWLMGAYQFTRYVEAKRQPARLFLHGVDTAIARRNASAIYLARDLINTPAGDLNTQALEDAVRALGDEFGATVNAIIGDELLAQNYPLVHAVGRASTHAPRLIELRWGKATHPSIALVGKGVVFDTGGLNIKTGPYMRLMKKDMGGAANALALARLIMAAKLPVQLHMVLPIVDNAISGDAYRPGDVLPSRKGLSVEIDNTDAEGRLVLADALTRASEAAPELLIDFATLTGAARVALGPEMAPFYCDDEALVADLQHAAEQTGDPVWRMPLWDGYDKLLNSPIADVCHTSSSPMGGSITAALFLRRFVGEIPWLHFDIFAWVETARPSHPLGGDAQGPRAVFALLEKRYG